MIIIYDFDGTLTPYTLPQYKIVKDCGYTDSKINNRVKREMEENKLDLYEAYWKVYINIFLESGIIMSKENICYGAKDTQFNLGVIDYFRRFQSSNTGIKHYIVTSGIKDYIEETPIAEFIDGIFGVEFKKENGVYTSVSNLLSDKKKVDIIKKIREENNDTSDIVYFGDGLTDRFAFEYVHEIGGTNVFVSTNKNSETNYNKINSEKIIDKYFEGDYSENSQISKFVESLKIQDK